MRKTILLIFVAMLAFTWSCQKEEAADKLVNEIENVLKAQEFEGTIPMNCGHLADCFTAGQHIDVGQFIIANDEESLYIKYEAEEPWLVYEVQFVIVKDLNDVPNARGNPVPGRFPYKFQYPEGVESAAFVLSLTELGYVIGEDIFVVAHAVVGKGIDDEGNIIDGETAFGGCIPGETGNRWWFYAEYTLAPCNGGPYPPVCFDWEGETAWSDGDRYENPGNWATYTEYDDADLTVILFAGQTLEAGIVHFSEVVNDEVTITITLNEGWRLVEEDEEGEPETVKIQGYEEAPSGNPAPGQFNTYKGTELIVTVPAFNFYGVHLDVEEWREVECPEEEEE